jgi:hypothetical protein
MCPLCLTTAAIIAATAISAGSAGVISAKLVHAHKVSNASPTINQKEKHS